MTQANPKDQDRVIQGEWPDAGSPPSPPTPEPKRPATGLMTRLGLGFGGFAPDIASRFPQERPHYVAAGFQLSLTWVLYFAFVSIAVTTMSGKWPLGLAAGAVIASLIYFTDRTILGDDAFQRGKAIIERERSAGDADPGPRKFHQRLAAVVRRGTPIVLRYAVGIGLSLGIAHLAVPGLFQDDIKPVMDDMQNQLNAELVENVALLSDSRRQDWQLLLEQRDILEARILELESDLDAAREATAPSGSTDAAAIDDLRSEITRLRSDAAKAEECAVAEEQGLRLPDCGAVQPSGASGCGARCRMWREKRDSLNTQAQQKQQELAAREQNAAQALTLNRERITGIEADLARLREHHAEVDQAAVAAEQAWANANHDLRPEDQPGFVPVNPGPVMTFKAAGILLDEAGPDVQQTVFFMKLLLILLESLAFTSRLLGGGIHGYARSLYLSYDNHRTVSEQPA